MDLLLGKTAKSKCYAPEDKVLAALTFMNPINTLDRIITGSNMFDIEHICKMFNSSWLNQGKEKLYEGLQIAEYCMHNDNSGWAGFVEGFPNKDKIIEGISKITNLPSSTKVINTLNKYAVNN